MSEMLDCLVIGGGPAGLTASIYLGRFRRRVTVIDKGWSRAEWITLSHNLPGFPNGIAGPALLEAMRAQARLYQFHDALDVFRPVEEQVALPHRYDDHVRDARQADAALLSGQSPYRGAPVAPVCAQAT